MKTKTLSRKALRREVVNDLANQIIDEDPELQERVRGILTNPNLSPARRGELLRNVRGNALQRAALDKGAIDRIVARVVKATKEAWL